MPLFSLIDHSPEHKIAVWKIEETVEELQGQLSISNSDREVVDSFKLDTRKKEWLASRLLLQKILGFYPVIEYSDNGKPFLKQDRPFISISHTRGYAAVSVSDKPTAIDIEICSDRVVKVANRFVHVDEEEYIQDDHLTEYLTVLWSAKEALYKYYDEYGVIFKKQFKVYPFEIRQKGDLSSDFFHNEQIRSLNLCYEVNDCFTLVYC